MFWIMLVGAIIGFLAVCIGVYVRYTLGEIRFSAWIIFIGLALEGVCFGGSFVLFLLHDYIGMNRII